MNARLLSGRPEARFLEGKKRKLLADVVVDLGYVDPRLHAWARRRGRFGPNSPDAGVWVSKNGTTVVRVPAGLVYDGASMPTLLPVRLLAGAKERYEVAAVLHDFLYQEQAGRALADHVWWVVAKSGAVNVHPARAWVTWAALRLFGWRAYRSHRQRL